MGGYAETSFISSRENGRSSINGPMNRFWNLRRLQREPSLLSPVAIFVVWLRLKRCRSKTADPEPPHPMSPNQTQRSYDKIAHHWASDTFNLQNGIAQHQRALSFSSRFGPAIDIGCGSNGRIIDLLLSQGFEVEGLDFSSEMLSLARKRHPEVLFHPADITTWKFPRLYDFISAWDSIWHVPLEMQEAVLAKLCAGLNPHGILIFTSGGVDVPGEVTNPCHGQPLYHAALGIPHLLRLIDRCGCVCRHLEYDQHPELHLYLIVQKLVSEKPPPPLDISRG
jgi:SAM-dependent methyltransferase